MGEGKVFSTLIQTLHNSRRVALGKCGEESFAANPALLLQHKLHRLPRKTEISSRANKIAARSRHLVGAEAERRR
jgi:hypothetical protein